jgi:D-aspartate ligase
MLKDSTTPVVVLGCFRHGGLGVTRSLGRLGVPVYCVDPDRYTPAFFSRYSRGNTEWDLHGAPAAATVQCLIELGARIGRRSVLITTSDLGAMLVVEQADRLREWYVFPEPEPAIVRALCSKKEMYYLARKCGVATPETAFPQCRDDVLEYLETARFPILLKPIFSNLPRRAVAHMVLVHTRQDLLERYDGSEESSSPNLMLQEFIPGGDDMTWTFNGYFDRQGECRIAFTGKKLRNYPPGFGQASLGICLKNDEVERTTIRFMNSIRYKGALDLGYRFDARDGRYKVNDVNPRVGAMFRLFVSQNGMDVVRALYQDMTGRRVVPGFTSEGRKWIVEDFDLMSASYYHRHRQLTLREWASSLRGIEETAYFAKDDLAPVWGICMFNGRKILGRARRWLARAAKIRPPPFIAPLARSATKAGGTGREPGIRR